MGSNRQKESNYRMQRNRTQVLEENLGILVQIQVFEFKIDLFQRQTISVALQLYIQSAFIKGIISLYNHTLMTRLCKMIKASSLEILNGFFII